MPDEPVVMTGTRGGPMEGWGAIVARLQAGKQL